MSWNFRKLIVCVILTQSNSCHFPGIFVGWNTWVFLLLQTCAFSCGIKCEKILVVFYYFRKNRQNNCSWISFFCSGPSLFTLVYHFSGFWLSWLKLGIIIRQQKKLVILSPIHSRCSVSNGHPKCSHFLGSQKSQFRKPVVKGGHQERNSCKETCEFAELQENEREKPNDSPCPSSLCLRWVLLHMAKWNLLFFNTEDEGSLEGEIQEKMVKGIKTDLSVTVSGYKILGVNNCDL